MLLNSTLYDSERRDVRSVLLNFCQEGMPCRPRHWVTEAAPYDPVVKVMGVARQQKREESDKELCAPCHTELYATD